MTLWIDTRTPEEFAAGHINGSILIPYDAIALHLEKLPADKSTDIRVYCRSGNRSGVAKQLLDQMGFSQVINEGGYEDLLRRKAMGQAIP